MGCSKKKNIDKHLLRACLDGGGGPRTVCDLTCSGGVKKLLVFTCNLTTLPSQGPLPQDT